VLSVDRRGTGPQSSFTLNAPLALAGTETPRKKKTHGLIRFQTSPTRLVSIKRARGGFAFRPPSWQRLLSLCTTLPTCDLRARERMPRRKGARIVSRLLRNYARSPLKRRASLSISRLRRIAPRVLREFWFSSAALEPYPASNVALGRPAEFFRTTSSFE